MAAPADTPAVEPAVSNKRVDSGVSTMGTRTPFAYMTNDPPPHIPDVDTIKDTPIPQGKLGVITDGALLSEHGDRKFVDKRFLQVLDHDISLPLKRAHMVLRKSYLASTATMMEREVMKEVITEDHERWGGCIALPVSITFFVFYLLAVVFHEAVTFTHITTIPIRRELEAGIGNVNTHDDIYTFLQQTYLPLLYAQYDSLDNPLPEERWSVIKQYSQLLGATEIELQRSVSKPCPDSGHVTCYPQSDLSGVAFGKPLSELPPPITSVKGAPWTLSGNWTWTTPTNLSNAPANLKTITQCPDEAFTSTGCSTNLRRLLDLRYEDSTTVPKPDDNAPKFTFILNSKDPYGKLHNRVEYLKQRGWLDAQSTTLITKSIVINNQFNVPRIIYIMCYFYFSRGGIVFTDLMVEGKALTMWGDVMSYPADAIFILMLFIRTFSTVGQIFQAASRKNWKLIRNATFFFSFVTILFSWLNILLMIMQDSSLGSTRKSLETYLTDSSVDNSIAFNQKVADMWFLVSYTRPIVAYANFFFLAQIFIALQWQPRLAVVTQTLLACGSDLFHYLIVLSATVAAFALSGMVIFGRRVIDFSDPFAAVAICFKIAIESEYDWNLLSYKEWMTSFTWVILYLLLVVMLMVNMVLAIIMDVYAEVRMHSGDNMTIFEHLTYIYRRLFYHNHWISDDQLLDQVSEMPRHITVSDIRQAFPEMHHYQLEYLQAQCQNKASRITRVGLNKTYTSQIVAAIQIGLEEVHDNLERLQARGWMSKGIETGSDGSREWVKDIFASIAAQNHWMNLTGKHISMLQLQMQGKTEAEEDEQRKQVRAKAGRSVKTRASQVS